MTSILTNQNRNRKSDNDMSLVRIRRAAQITLPADARKAFDLKEGDYLEAELRDGGILLRPVSVVDREQDRENLRAVLAKVKPTKAGQALDDDEVMAVVVDEIKTARREQRAKSAGKAQTKA